MTDTYVIPKNILFPAYHDDSNPWNSICSLRFILPWAEKMFIRPVARVFIICSWFTQGFPGGASGKEPTFQCRRHKRQGIQSLGWEDPLQQGMTTHSHILAWEISWTEEPGGLQSSGSQRVRQDWRDSIHTHRTDILRSKVILWKRKWQPTPVILPGESHGQRKLAGYSPWDCKESGMT